MHKVTLVGVQRLVCALLFVVAGDVIKADYTRKQLPDILSRWAGKSATVEACLESGVWNASQSGLCKFCPLSADMCEHR
jgi:hypothetical protein